jgi:NADPH-dependent 2,4-dienoyl-CoA reductase/sulfur reductase-like enzyme
MIMARRLTLEGAKVERVLEVMPFLTGLTRNYVQCLLDYDIPLQLSHTVNRIIGDKRVEAIEAVQVDERWNPIPGAAEIIPCDTLLLSVGLVPENELSRKAGVRLDPVTSGPYVDNHFETSVPGIFDAGNVVHVYDLVDWVTEAGFLAGKSAAQFAFTERQRERRHIPILAGENVRYVVPHEIDKESLAQEEIHLQMRVKTPIEDLVWVELRSGDHLVTRKTEAYARPGEIITLRLTPKQYDEVSRAGELSLSVTKK